ncbi:MAG: hypothetical protein ACO1RA_12010 [Planctomycetaceae bacterium]
MLVFLFICFLDAGLLVFLLKTLNNEDVDMSTAFMIAVGTSVVTGLLVVALAMAIGVLGIVLGDLLGAIALAVALSALFGIEIKRACLISSLFIAGHSLLYFVLNMMMR